MHRICIKWHGLMWPNKKTSWVVLYDDASIPRWRISTLALLGHNFGIDQHFCTKFPTRMENQQPMATYPLVRNHVFKIHDGGRPPSWILILGHKFGVDQHFCTKFGSLTYVITPRKQHLDLYLVFHLWTISAVFLHQRQPLDEFLLNSYKHISS